MCKSYFCASEALSPSSKMPSELRQFICRKCPGKYSYHKYRLWYERVDTCDLKSECRGCRRMMDAVPRGEEEGVHNCNFACSCGNTFVVHCEMQDTAPCYECREWLSPHSFQPLRPINRKSDNVHCCSKCKGKGNCPNKKGLRFLESCQSG